MTRRPVRAVLAAAVDTLTAAGTPSPRADAELLACHVLGVPRNRLPLVSGFDPDQLGTFTALVDRRTRHEPVQHLIGTAAFRYLELAVGPGVFVPRPETELLVDWALAALRAVSGRAVVVDLCAGSGAIALAVAQEAAASGGNPVEVYAVEREPAALVWLRRNAAGTAVRVVAGDATDPAVLADLDGTVDLVLSNPPYLPSGVADELPMEVVGYDPHTALYAGADGLAVIGPVAVRAATLLRPGGGFGVEHDDTHGTSVPRLLAADDRWRDVTEHRDLAGRPRFCTARRC